MQRRRHPHERDRRYLNALIGWGYQPADVEQLILAKAEADPEQADAEQADATMPYQKAGDWWYRYRQPTTGEVRPRGPFESNEDALADALELAKLAAEPTEVRHTAAPVEDVEVAYQTGHEAAENWDQSGDDDD